MTQFDVIQSVMNWNVERNLHTQGFNSSREFGFILEEMWEGLGVKNALFEMSQNIAHSQSNGEIVLTNDELKKKFRDFVKSYMKTFQIMIDSADEDIVIPPADVADAFGDIIVFSIGALTKICNDYPDLGTPHSILETICKANDAKGKATDGDGKIVKNSDFVEPVFKKNTDN